MRKRLLFIRNFESGMYLETVFLSAVVTILLIRFFLHLANYPQVGGSGLHIAHMLWGGLLMFVAIILLLAFLGRFTMKMASVVGGIGFGTFIDELGKFITHDNNYFFEPTVALIYIIFVLLFLFLRFLERRQVLSEQEYLENALELTKGVILDPRETDQKREALALLAKCDQSSPVITSLQHLLAAIPLTPSGEHIFLQLKQRVRRWYQKLFHNPWFSWGIIVFFIGLSFVGLYRSSDVLSLFFRLDEFTLSYPELGQFASSIASSLVVFVGILRLKKHRLSGLRFFKDSVLVSVFLTQFFDFYNHQFDALFMLIFNLLVLGVLEYMLSEEQLLLSPKKEYDKT